MTEKLRYCFGDSEGCRDPKPASAFWRGGNLCSQCRKEAARVRKNAYRRKWHANKVKTDPAWAERYSKRVTASYRKRHEKPEKREARRKYWKQRYRLDAEYRARRLEEAREKYARKAEPVFVCGAYRGRPWRGMCTEKTKHPSRKCKWHRQIERVELTGENLHAAYI